MTGLVLLARLSACLVCTLAVTAQAQAEKKERNMDKMEAVFDVRNPTPDSMEAMADRLRDDGRLGIHLFAPSALSVGEDFSLPMAIMDFYDAARRGGRFLANGGTLVATRLESLETFAALVVEPKEPAGEPAPRSAAAAPAAAGQVVKRFTLDVRERFPEMPWKAGTYLVDVLFGDEASNRARVEMSPGRAAESDPAVAEFLRRQRSSEPAPPLHPAARADSRYPSYGDALGAPALPEGEAIVLEADRVQVAHPQARSVLKGSYRLTLPDRFLGGQQADGTPGAAVPITLVLMGNLHPAPAMVRLVVPARVAPGALAKQVTGHFAIDLFALREAPRVAQTYTVVAYCGEVRSAPVKMAYVSPEMIKH